MHHALRSCTHTSLPRCRNGVLSWPSSHCASSSSPSSVVFAQRCFSLFSRNDGDKITRLGGSSSQESVSSMMTARTNAPDRSDAEKLIATLQENNRALAERVKHLLSELEHTQQIVKEIAPLVDHSKHVGALKDLERTLTGGGGLFLVRNSADLAKALTLPGARIVLEKGRLYVLDMFESVRIRNTTVSIIGNGATIVGTFAVSDDATLDITDACLVSLGGAKPISAEQYNALSADDRAKYPFCVPETAPLSVMESRHLRPVVSATSNSQVNLTRCTLSNGRDGVYLGLSSRAYLESVSVVNCVRGVYEGVDCRAMLSGDCAFIGNYYHLVLLGKEKETRARAVMASRSRTPDAANANTSDRLYCVFKDIAEHHDICNVRVFFQNPVRMRTSRADICLDQNPISDTYDACWKNGEPVKLAEAHRTANLSDPVY